MWEKPQPRGVQEQKVFNSLNFLPPPAVKSQYSTQAVGMDAQICEYDDLKMNQFWVFKLIP